MAGRGTLLAIGAAVGLGGLALLVGTAKADEADDDAPVPSPPAGGGAPPAGGGGGGAAPKTPKQIAMAHPNYQDWLYAAQQCDEALASDDPGGSALLGFCEDANYFANVMVNDGVPPGAWR